MTPADPTDERATEMGEQQLTVRRTFDASRERVFRAFTDPEELVKWYAPGEMTAEVHALDPEPGGDLSISMHGDDGTHSATGTFVEVVENERLVHTWQWEAGPFDEESRVTVEFHDVDGGTEVVLTHEKLGSRESVEEHTKGWSGVLENLARAL